MVGRADHPVERARLRHAPERPLAGDSPSPATAVLMARPLTNHTSFALYLGIGITDGGARRLNPAVPEYQSP
jgi:hypothetical protein